MRFTYLKFIYSITAIILHGQVYSPETGALTFYPKKYISLSLGDGKGDFSLSAESAFSDPQNPRNRLWEAEVSDVLLTMSRPQLTLKFGGWKGWQGIEMEISYNNQNQHK